jgi:hypothetical protein
LPLLPANNSFEEKSMTRILVIGYAPEAVDFSDPAIPEGVTPEIIANGIEKDGQKMRDMGWESHPLFIRPNKDVRQCILSHLATNTYDVIVIGGGVRMTTKFVPVCEQVVNAIREGAPKTPIAFNEGPDTSSEAAKRWLSK